MLTKFWESAGSGLGGQWIQYIFGPAFSFWGGGLIIIVFQFGFYKVWNWISSRDVPTQVAVLIVGLFVIILSSKIMEQWRFSLLRLLEGYWIWPLSYLVSPLTNLQKWLMARNHARWNTLMEKIDQGNLSSNEKRELARLETNGHYLPADKAEYMPTILGNVLRSAESTPHHKYGLDAVVCWPRLWLLLPKEVQEVLSSVRQKLDRLVELWAWGLFFLIWMFWWRWAFLISILWMAFVYLLAVQSARTYADLIESAFDLYRWNLYESVRWSVPKKSGEAEIAYGRQLTEFLWRGTSISPVQYEAKANK